MADENTEKPSRRKHLKLNYGFKRLYKHFKIAGMNIETFSFSKIKGVYKRLKLKGKRIRTVTENVGLCTITRKSAHLNSCSTIPRNSRPTRPAKGNLSELKVTGLICQIPMDDRGREDQDQVFGLVIHLNFLYGLKFLQTVIYGLGPIIYKTQLTRGWTAARNSFPLQRGNLRIGIWNSAAWERRPNGQWSEMEK